MAGAVVGVDRKELGGDDLSTVGTLEAVEMECSPKGADELSSKRFATFLAGA